MKWVKNVVKEGGKVEERMVMVGEMREMYVKSLEGMVGEGNLRGEEVWGMGLG